MKLKKSIQNNKGIGLIEVLVASSIAVGLSLVVAQIISDADKNAKQVQSKIENGSLKTYVQTLLTSEVACKNTFSSILTPAAQLALGASPTYKLTVPAIKNQSNDPKVSLTPAPTLIVTSPLTLTEIYLTNYSTADNTGNLTIKTAFNKTPTSSFELSPIVIPISFTYAAGVLDTCVYGPSGGGGGGSGWLLAGNAGTNPATDFIGTTDDVPLIFKVNGLQAGRIDSDSVTTASTFFGYSAGLANTTGEYNTAFGTNALFKNTTGANNTAIGRSALVENISGNGNTAIGALALQVSTGNSNTAIGAASLRLNTTGSNNTAVGAGALALSSTNTSSNNTALGSNALYGDLFVGLTGYDNTAVGANALRFNSTGRLNTATGFASLSSNTTGYTNTANGHTALALNTTGNNNTAIGTYSLAKNTSGGGNTALGVSALFSNTTANSNTAIGELALALNTTGANNTAVGTGALSRNIVGERNTAIGSSALLNTITDANTAIGFNTLMNNTTGSANVAIGVSALANNLTGSSNIAIGQIAMNGNLMTGSDNIALGSYTLSSNSSGIRNIGLGVSVLQTNSIGRDNIGLGYVVLQSNTIGDYNIGLGGSTLNKNINGSRNVSLGHATMINNTAGNDNTVIGYGAAKVLTIGSNNVIIGDVAAPDLIAGDNNIIIGAGAGDLLTGSNQLAIGRVGTFQPLIYGDQTLKTAGINGSLKIGSGISNPGTLYVNGNALPPYPVLPPGDGYFTGAVKANGVTLTSDMRLKEKIEPIQNNLEKISKLKGYSFFWKNKENSNNKKQLGLMAQEVEKIFPEVVVKSSDGFLSVAYMNLIAPVIGAINELYDKFLKLVVSDENQNAEIESLKSENQQLKLQLKAFDQRLQEIETKIKK